MNKRCHLVSGVLDAGKELGAHRGLPRGDADFSMVWRKRSFRFMVLGAALHSFVGYGVGYWIPAFFMRSHDMGTGLIGTEHPWFADLLFWLKSRKFLP